MSCAVVWSSKTGNTELLARSIVEFVGDDCVYAGGPSSDALGADRVYVGFWTDKGSCDESITAFLTALDPRRSSCSARRASVAQVRILSRYSQRSAR